MLYLETFYSCCRSSWLSWQRSRVRLILTLVVFGCCVVHSRLM